MEPPLPPPPPPSPKSAKIVALLAQVKNLKKGNDKWRQSARYWKQRAKQMKQANLTAKKEVADKYHYFVSPKKSGEGPTTHTSHGREATS